MNTPRDLTAAEAAEAYRLVAYALHLRQYGERAPGGTETWAEFDQRAEALLVPNQMLDLAEDIEVWAQHQDDTAPP